MSGLQIEDWVSQDEWFQARGSKLFANRTRWDWFLRKHRKFIASKGCIGQLGKAGCRSPRLPRAQYQ